MDKSGTFPTPTSTFPYETLFRPKVHSKLENQTLDSVWNPPKRMVLKGGGGVFMSRPVVLFTQGGKYDDK